MKIEYLLIKKKDDFCSTRAQFKSLLLSNKRIAMDEESIHFSGVSLRYTLTDQEVIWRKNKEILFYFTVSIEEENINKLQTQREELNGAIVLTKKIQNDSLDTNRLDIDKYWNILEDEERKGGKFMDIAKDIVRTEKGVVFSFMGWTDRDGNLYNSASDIGKFCGLVILIACIYCVVRNEWSAKNFVFGMSGVLVLIAVEGILSIPLYFLRKSLNG